MKKILINEKRKKAKELCILSKDKGKPIFNIHLIILKKDINNPSLKNNLHTLYEVNKCV